MSRAAALKRTTFEMSRALEYFTEKELQMQIGHERDWWPVVILKELIDNALDACEMAGTPPSISIEVAGDCVSVTDNGPGLPPETLAGSLDYLKRVSDKSYYVSPTRGQMGSAIKAAWAAPFVASGEGFAEVWTRGERHRVEVVLNRISQVPEMHHEREPSEAVKTGARFEIHWPDSSRQLTDPKRDSYHEVPTAAELVAGFVAFNPHAAFRLNDAVYEPTAATWKKWQPDDPTSPHWYTPETLRDLIAAYVAQEQAGGRPKTIREFVSEFRGLSSTRKRAAITDGLPGVHLRELARNGDIDMRLVEELLRRMQAESKPPKASALGVIGKDHLQAWLVAHGGSTQESIRYVRKTGGDCPLPYVAEVAFGVNKDDGARRRILTGLNWSPCIGSQIPTLNRIVQQQRLDRGDPVTLLVHLARPRFDFVDRGKTRLDL